MMRRRPYAELPGVGLSAGKIPAPDPSASTSSSTLQEKPVTTPRPASPAPASTVLKQETVLRYNAEIRNMYVMIEQQRMTADPEGVKACAFTSDKLGEASKALERGDAEAAWFILFGAAKLWRNFGFQPEKAERAVHRIKCLLE